MQLREPFLPLCRRLHRRPAVPCLLLFRIHRDSWMAHFLHFSNYKNPQFHLSLHGTLFPSVISGRRVLMSMVVSTVFLFLQFQVWYFLWDTRCSVARNCMYSVFPPYIQHWHLSTQRPDAAARSSLTWGSDIILIFHNH